MRTGTTSFGPMYPMIPHISLFLSVGDPVFDVALLARRNGERIGRNVFTNRGAAADVRAFADRDRRDELRVAPDERAVFDRRLIFLLAVVVARDRAGADVHLLADCGVAEIGEMSGLRPGAEHRLLQLDEVTDVRAFTHVGAVAQVRERTEARVARDA